MRLWHKDLIPVLPRQQLLSQWRECCCIARNIAVNGTPNHLLVNKVLDYPPAHLHEYAARIDDEMTRRGYKCEWSKFAQWNIGYKVEDGPVSNSDLFAGWHDERYLRQCFYNLEEKHDCGGISDDEWKLLVDFIHNSGRITVK